MHYYTIDAVTTLKALELLEKCGWLMLSSAPVIDNETRLEISLTAKSLRRVLKQESRNNYAQHCRNTSATI